MLELKQLFKDKNIYYHGHFACLNKVDSDIPYSLVYCEDLHYLEEAAGNSNVSAIITTNDLLNLLNKKIDKGVIVIDNPKFEYWKLFNRLVDEKFFSFKMDVGVGRNCKIHATAVISEKSLIGDNVTIGANAVIQEYSIIGNNSVIAPGVIIGAEGMQLIENSSLKMFIKHTGGTKIGENVTVLSNSVIQKAVLPVFTEIGDGCNLSVLVSIGHQSRIGKNCSFAGNVLIGGSVELGDDITVGPSATIKDGLKIGSGAQIKLGSVVVKDVKAGETVSGNFAISHIRNLKHYAKKLR